MSGKATGDVYIVLFRGVGGATQLPVAKLRAALTKAGFGHVSTYINSGNAILASDRGRQETHRLIGDIARRDFDFDQEIMLASRDEWQRIIDANPFPEAADSPTRLHVFVLKDEPKQKDVEALQARAAGERLHVSGNILYLHVPDGFSASKLPPVVDRLLGTVSTARNWRTVLALGKLASEIGLAD